MCSCMHGTASFCLISVSASNTNVRSVFFLAFFGKNPKITIFPRLFLCSVVAEITLSLSNQSMRIEFVDLAALATMMMMSVNEKR